MQSNITYTVVDSKDDLTQILLLQEQNLPSNLSPIEAQREGFVTLQHSMELISRMNIPYPHIIAKVDAHLIGYALVMLRRHSQDIPILFPMFDQFKRITYVGKPLLKHRFFIMGQVCVHKDYRGMGVLKGMYRKLQCRMKKDFDYVVTEISKRNERSIRAHTKLGFDEIHTFQSESGEDWSIIILPLKD